jgi:hypothetical protein
MCSPGIIGPISTSIAGATATAMAGLKSILPEAPDPTRIPEMPSTERTEREARRRAQIKKLLEAAPGSGRQATITPKGRLGQPGGGV